MSDACRSARYYADDVSSFPFPISVYARPRSSSSLSLRWRYSLHRKPGLAAAKTSAARSRVQVDREIICLHRRRAPSVCWRVFAVIFQPHAAAMPTANTYLVARRYHFYQWPPPPPLWLSTTYIVNLRDGSLACLLPSRARFALV